MSSWRERSIQRSASVFPPPLVRKIYGLFELARFFKGVGLTYTFIPYSFSPLSTFIASTASGMGRPPRIKTPSISKAKAKESAVGTSAGVMGELGVSGELDVGESILSSSRLMAANSFLAVSREAAKPPWSDWDL